MEKQEICEILSEIAVLLELKGENPFKIRAYENAVHALEMTDHTIEKLIETEQLSELKGIGSALTEKITELYKTDHLKYYDDLKKSIPPGLLDLLKLQGVGAKKASILNKKLGIKTLSQLEKACRENKLLDIKGFGEKTQENILKSIEFINTHKSQYLISTAMDYAKDILKHLKKCKNIIRIELGGSLRRKKELVKDIDILASSDKPETIMDLFMTYPQTHSIIGHGKTKSSIILENGINVDLRVVSDEQYPYALQHFTGSKEHNVHMRGLAKQKNIKMNEYGLWKKNKNIACKNEEDIYQALGLNYIPPELREDLNEIEFASKHKFPVLIENKDIKGTIHVHTTWSDGHNTLEEMVIAAKNMGYSYIGITEHSQSAGYAGGLTPEKIKEQKKVIDNLNKTIKGITILQGIEVEILKDGSLDYPDNILAMFDFTIPGIHTKFKMTEKEMTDRLIKALKNKYTTILAHPTGRLLLEREPYPVDINAVIQAAADYGKIIEINSQPKRLDLDWRHIKHAKDKGVDIIINTDAHNTESLKYMEYGIGIARKGWLTKKDVVNTLSLEDFCKRIHHS
ncbi:DNA polymerase/3'-5' exonuclease PolX [bacterium]|nr:DNA polymerase/3'-5' exonuclease PolX [bacterium]